MSNLVQSKAFGNITSANSTAILSVDKVFPAGINLQQYATDQSITMDELTMAETRMGVDGYLAAGWVPNIKAVTIMLEASSPSYEAMVQAFGAQEQARTLYECSLTVRIPSIGSQVSYSGGVFKSGTPFPSHKKVLEPTTWKFEFAKMTVSRI